MNKKFEIPELEIIYFEDDLATDNVVTSGGYGQGWGGQAGDEYWGD